jgi:hypothetical protein
MQAVADCTETGATPSGASKDPGGVSITVSPVRSSGRSLNPALETFLRSTAGADDIILGSVMSLGVERFRPTNPTL